MADRKPIELSSAGLAARVPASRLLLVDFRADWCAPCRAMEPHLAAFARSTGDVDVAKLDVDANPDAPETYSVLAVPTLILFRGGAEVARASGFHDRGAIERLVAPHRTG